MDHCCSCHHLLFRFSVTCATPASSATLKFWTRAAHNWQFVLRGIYDEAQLHDVENVILGVRGSHDQGMARFTQAHAKNGDWIWFNKVSVNVLLSSVNHSPIQEDFYQAVAETTQQEKDSRKGYSTQEVQCKHNRPKNKCKTCKRYCHHNRSRYTCKECGGSALCDHNRQKHTCPECCPCEHGRVKHRCHECGGSAFCEHGREKYVCKECGGSGICEHGTDKRRCKECSGSAVCEHKRAKRVCKECDGAAICQHGKVKYVCRECHGSSICEHDRVKQRCKECSGSAFCEHGRETYTCKECGGRGICEHGKQKQSCRECEGSSICSHGRMKHQCKECHGSAICEHGRVKQRCKDCDGSSLCEHGRQNQLCKECGGSAICDHGKVKYSCKECGGSAICEHGRRKYLCMKCGGSGLCEHGKPKYYCPVCGGSGLCEHGKRLSCCRECGASRFCQHGKDIYCCSECLSAERMIESKRWCIACCSTQLSPNRIRAGVRVCAQCDPTVPQRVEKIVIPMFVEAIGFPPSSFDNVLIGGAPCDTNRRRPDACWITTDRIAVLEIDEHGHNDYDPSCEVAKVIDQTISVQAAYPGSIVLHFRFNPLEFDRRAVGLDARVAHCAKDIHLFLHGARFSSDEHWRVEIPYILYYFYPRSAYFQIAHAFNQSAGAVRVLVSQKDVFRNAHDLVDVETSWCRE